jgi:O-antigen/teichoic acid export membrane protein
MRLLASTPLQDRSGERYRRLARTVGTSAISKAASLLVTLVSVPLTIGYLGTERFALWMIINSLMAMLMFADLGLGNGLLTALSESDGKNDPHMARRYISSAFFMLSAMGIILIVILAVTYRNLPWARLMGAQSGVVATEAGPAVAVFLSCLAINLPLSIVQRTQMGFQNGYTNNVWNAVGALFGFVGIVVCAHVRAGVPFLVLSVALGPILATVFNGLQLFRSQPELRPRWKEFHWLTLKRLLSVGCGFLIMQAALAMAVGSDNFVIAHLLGPDAVTQYSIAMRIFTLVPAIIVMLLTPLWPAYGESFARGETNWAVQTLKRSAALVSVATIFSAIVLTIFGPWIITQWVGNRFHEGFWLLSGMGVWMVVNGLANVVSIFLNGINRIQVQVFSAIVVGISTLAIELAAAPKFGLPAIIWATDISFICFILVPIVVFFPRLLRNLGSSTASSFAKTTVAVTAN